MRSPKSVLIPLLALPLVVLGCGRRQADEKAAAGTPAMTTEAPATTPAGEVSQVVLGAVELGKALSPDGDVTAASTTFQPGEPVFAGVETSTLSPGTTIRLEWIGPRGVRVGTDDVMVPPGARVITLKAKDTSAWAPGSYRVEVAVGGAKVGSKPFTVTG